MSKSQMTISGRIVWTLAQSNNPMEVSTSKNRQTGQVILTKAGQPRLQTTFSLAVPKNSPQLAQLEQLKQVEIYKIYPSGQAPKTFAYKMIDGDTDVDDKGFPYSKREGHAGHIIIMFNSHLPVKWWRYNGASFEEITAGVKTGDFVDVDFEIKAHGPNPNGGVAGFYVQPLNVLFTGIGDAIEKKIQAADPSKVFANPTQVFGAQPQAQQPQFAQQAQQPQFAQQAQQPQFAQQAQQPQTQWNQQQVQPQQAAPYYGGLPPQFQKQ